MTKNSHIFTFMLVAVMPLLLNAMAIEARADGTARPDKRMDQSASKVSGTKAFKVAPEKRYFDYPVHIPLVDQFVSKSEHSRSE